MKRKENTIQVILALEELGYKQKPEVLMLPFNNFVRYFEKDVICLYLKEDMGSEFVLEVPNENHYLTETSKSKNKELKAVISAVFEEKA